METPAPNQGRRKILFLTNSDRGEFGVVIATAQAMLEVSPADIELHIGTYAGVEELITQVSDESVKLNPQAVPITYHNIAKSATYLDMLALLKSRNIETKPWYLPMSFLRKPSFSNTLQAIQDSAPILVPMDGPQMEKIVLQALEIIGAVKPDFIVVNSVMTAGLTAAVHSKIPSCILSPNAIKDFSSSLQPYAAVFWKFPSLFSGFSYPIPWHLKPVNTLYVLWAAKVLLFDDHRKAVEQHLETSSGITLHTPIKLLHNKLKGMQILVSTLPELDFPLTIPKHIHPCGPIIGRWRPIGESDPELTQWLSRGPTMYINLGSLCLTDEDQALEMAGAIKLVLDRARQEPGMEALQAIWKLKKYGEYDTEGPKCAMYDVLGPEMEAGLVRIEKWFIPEPLSILQSGHIACSVHHGGANSFNEAVMSGLPQVVLPPWTDCYDYAQRAELHGLGRWGSKESNPQWASRELADAMSWCLFGETARVCRQKTKNMAALVESRGRGAVKAAEFIIRQVEANAKAAQGHA